MLPVSILIIPLYTLFVKLNLLNNFLSIIIVYTALSLPLGVWLFRGFFATIPIEIEEAAMIDGCSRLQALFKVTLPLLGPAIGAVSMYIFLFCWNHFLIALVLATAPEIRPIAVAMTFYKGDTTVDWGALLSASILMTIPPIIVFSSLQKYFSKGMTEGAVIE
jgi:multiple sugar transport system permease protein